MDSSVGGKTGINVRQGKNLVGSFYQPILVAIDTQVLQTLPQRQLFAGYAEVVKYGLIKDCSFFDWLELNGKKVLEGDKLAQQFAIFTSCRIKAEIVEADEKEQDLRAILNFGHTFGHALEAEAGYDGNLLHGEAVSIGLIFAARLAQRLGRIDAARLNEHLDVVGDLYGLKTEIPKVGSADELLELMFRDKKAIDGLTFVLDGPNGVEPVVGVDAAVVREVLDEALNG